jgi:hypothetical protein
MTQKSGLFKGQQKKSAAPNRHGKEIHIRKGILREIQLQITLEFSLLVLVSEVCSLLIWLRYGIWGIFLECLALGTFYSFENAKLLCP